MNEPKRYFTSPLGFTDGTDYIEFDNGKITFVFVNGARQQSNGWTIGEIEEAVSRKVLDEYSKPPAGTVRVIIEKVESLSHANMLNDEKEVPKLISHMNANLDLIGRGELAGDKLKEALGDVFVSLVVLCQSKGVGIVPSARTGYEVFQAALSQSEKLDAMIPVDLPNGRVDS